MRQYTLVYRGGLLVLCIVNQKKKRGRGQKRNNLKSKRENSRMCVSKYSCLKQGTKMESLAKDIDDVC